MDLTGQAVIITGSSSGIGEALARRLSDLGAGIVVNSARSVAAGQRVADSLPRRGLRAGRHRRPGDRRRRWSPRPGSAGAGWTAWSTTPVSPWTCRCTTSTRSRRALGQGAAHQRGRARSSSARPRSRCCGEAGDGWIINITSLAGHPADGQLAAVRRVQGRAQSPHRDHGQARRRRRAGQRRRPRPRSRPRGPRTGTSARRASSRSRRCTGSPPPTTSPRRASRSSPPAMSPAARSWPTAASASRSDRLGQRVMRQSRRTSAEPVPTSPGGSARAQVRWPAHARSVLFGEPDGR